MAMDEDFLREVAAQLRKPNGKFGKEVAEKMNASNQQMNLKTIELLDILENDSVLEIGMGNGAFVPDILNSAKDVRYFGIDYSEDMVELANTMNNSFIVDHTVKFILSDVENLPFSSKTMDKIFTVNTIYFWKDLEAAFRECSRVLKEDGLFAITIRPKGCLKKYPSTQFNFNYFNIVDIQNLFEHHGFEIYKTVYECEPETEVLENMIIPEFAVIIGKKVA